MSQANPQTDHAEAVRLETTALIDSLTERGREFDLPQPPEALAAYRQRLFEGRYKVLVVGEAKRGKSTFVNALIGRDLLPTDVDVATSQVFHVTPAPHAAFRLRFEDDSAREIAAEDLARFGSQVVADSEGVPQLNELIRWIEVEGPISFLPKGVSILDTPGLGALYTAHAQITHRFIPLADAVIFVLDSGQPILQEEIDFIESILGVTGDIFFIQTKIDLYGREHWQATQRRNEEILAKRLGDALTDRRVWPISSTNLRKAADPGNQDAELHLLVSRHRELAAALRAFLFRVSGWRRAGEALVVAERHHKTARQPILTRLASLTEESKQRRQELQQSAARLRRDFDEEWGERGQKRRQLSDDIGKVIEVARQDFRQALSVGGQIESGQRRRIEALASVEGVQRHGEAVSAEVLNAAAKHWTRVCRESQVRCAALLSPFIEATEALIAIEAPDDSSLPPADRAVLEFEDVLWKKIKGARSEWLAASGVAGFAGYFAVLVFPALIVPASLAITAVGLWAARKGWRDATRRELDGAKQKLRLHVGNVLQEARRHFFDVDLGSGRQSLVNEYFNALQNNLLDQVKRLAQQKSAEAQSELARMVEHGKLDERARAAHVGEARRQLEEWDKLGTSITALAKRLGELGKLYAAPAEADK